MKTVNRRGVSSGLRPATLCKLLREKGLAWRWTAPPNGRRRRTTALYPPHQRPLICPRHLLGWHFLVTRHPEKRSTLLAQRACETAAENPDCRRARQSGAGRPRAGGSDARLPRHLSTRSTARWSPPAKPGHLDGVLGSAGGPAEPALQPSPRTRLRAMITPSSPQPVAVSVIVILLSWVVLPKVVRTGYPPSARARCPVSTRLPMAMGDVAALLRQSVAAARRHAHGSAAFAATCCGSQ